MSGWKNGVSEPTLSQLDEIATLFDCTTDFLLGRTWNGVKDIRVAASAMSYDVFELTASPERRERCRRVLGHPAAPVTAAAWRDLAEQIDLAVGPSPALALAGTWSTLYAHNLSGSAIDLSRPDQVRERRQGQYLVESRDREHPTVGVAHDWPQGI